MPCEENELTLSLHRNGSESSCPRGSAKVVSFCWSACLKAASATSCCVGAVYAGVAHNNISQLKPIIYDIRFILYAFLLQR